MKIIESNLLKKLTHIQHGFTTRHGGVSTGIFEGLNMKIGTGDLEANVLKNKKIIQEYFQADTFIMNEQIHSTDVCIVGKTDTYIGDALIAYTPNVLIGVMTADCVPILLAHSKKPIIACIHAGWKGAINGVIENTLKNFEDPELFYAAIGPCIQQISYEINNEFYQQIPEKEFFKDKKYFDLPGYAIHKLKIAGIHYIDNLNIDTYTNTDNFFSYRRSINQQYGTQASVINIKN